MFSMINRFFGQRWRRQTSRAEEMKKLRAPDLRRIRNDVDQSPLVQNNSIVQDTLQALRAGIMNYANLSDKSGVWKYKIYEKSIDVWFKDGSCYRYTYDATGKDNTEHMKLLAKRGLGLNRFINKSVKFSYQAKIA